MSDMIHAMQDDFDALDSWAEVAMKEAEDRLEAANTAYRACYRYNIGIGHGDEPYTKLMELREARAAARQSLLDLQDEIIKKRGDLLARYGGI